MKKATIWFLTIIMALTFGGLLYIQIMYMNDMIRMRDDQFVEGVRRSLYSVSTTLEQDETRHFLEEDAAAIERSIYSQVDNKTVGGGIGSLNYSFTTPEGLQANLAIPSRSPSHKTRLRITGIAICRRAYAVSIFTNAAC